MAKTGDVLFIRCSKRTKIRFKVFAAAHSMRYEDALNVLLDLAERYPHLLSYTLRKEVY
jgi:hypothetical protein